MKLKYIPVLIVLAALFNGCATGPSFTSYSAGIPQPEAQKARIYFYRTAVMGAAVQPKVRVNDVVVGTATPQGAFYYDCEPGDYTIETSTEVKRKLTLHLDAGDVRYVRLGISMGFMVGHVYPELVDNEVGRNEIMKCKYTGMDQDEPPAR